MEHDSFERRQVLRLVGAGAVVGGLTGEAAANEGQEEGPQPYIIGATSKAAENAARSRAARVGRVIDLGTVRAVAGDFAPQAVDALAGRPDVEYVEEDLPMQALNTEVENAWGVDRVDAEIAHVNDGNGDGSNETGSGAHVAIIDTGIDSDHPDLSHVDRDGGHAVDGYACDGCTYEWEDDNGHGTHCAGIAAAVDDGNGVVGVSPDATLHAVKVLDSGGSGTASSVADGINWVANNADSWGPTVASLSLGGGSTNTLEQACQKAYDAGILVVAAAGNSGNSTPPCNNDCIGYPAAYDTVIAVTATNRCDAVTNWSSTGPEAEIAAPGAVIYSTVPGGGYDTKSGTSMACPHVSGAGAVLMASGYLNATNKSNYEDPGGARGQLRDTAETVEHDPNGSSYDNSYGYGLLDVENAALGGTGGDDLMPIVTTDDATVSETDATLNGHTTADEVYGCADATGYFQYRLSGSTDSWEDAGSETVTKDDTDFSTTVTLSADTEYEFRAVLTLTASNGWSVTGNGSEVTFTTGSGDGGGGDGSDTTLPSGDIVDSDLIENNNPHSEYSVDWTASDDVELAEVTVDLRREDDETIVDSVSTPVTGESASGTTEVSEHMGSRSNNSHEVRLVVTDAAGNTYEGTWEPAQQ